MLKMNHLIENFDLARAALLYWGHDADTLDEHLQYFRISSNAIYPFASAGRLCFLRLAPVEEKLLSNIQGEIEFILYLRRCGYPALEPIPSVSGGYILTLDTLWGRYYATAFYGVQGEPIEDSDFSYDICQAYGKALGRLHKLSQGFIPAVRKQTHEDILDIIEGRLRDFCCGDALLNGLSTLRGELSTLPCDAMHYGLVHYDFECDNVFYDAETGSCNVIDFDDGIYHFYALDIEQALDSIREEAGPGRAVVAEEAFLSGYKTEFPFDEASSKTLPLMRLFCNYYSYSRLLHCLSGEVEPQPDWMVELRQKLQCKADSLREALLQK